MTSHGVSVVLAPMTPCLPFLERRASGANTERVDTAESETPPTSVPHNAEVTSAPHDHHHRHHHTPGPSDSSSSSSSSPPSLFAHLTDVWEIDALQVDGDETQVEADVKNSGTSTELDTKNVALAAETLKRRLLKTGKHLRSDPFSPKAQVVANAYQRHRAKNNFTSDPLSETIGESDDDEEEVGEKQKILLAEKNRERSEKKKLLLDRCSIDRRDKPDYHQHVLGLNLKENSAAFEHDDKEDITKSITRMETSLKSVLLFQASVFRHDESYQIKKREAWSMGNTSVPTSPPTPPLGTHLIRRTALDADTEHTKRTLDLYVQDQCSYIYDHAVRTVDHFIDGQRQKIHGSMKMAFAPTAVPMGGAVVVDLNAPGKFMWDTDEDAEGEGTKDNEKVSCEESCEESAESDSEFVVVENETGATDAALDSDASDSDDVSDSDSTSSSTAMPLDSLPPWTRQGSYVELGGCSGHPDYLKRVPDPKMPSEVYEISQFPSLRFEKFVKATPIARFVGRLQVDCETTGISAVLNFKPYDAQFAVKTGVRSNLISGSIFDKKTGKIHKLLCGTTEGDLESIGVDNVDSLKNSVNSVHSDESTDTGTPPPPTVLIRGLCPYLNSTRGGFDARQVLLAPGTALLKRLWHSVVDAMHAKDLCEPLNSVKYELLQPLKECAAKLILGQDEKYIGAVGVEKEKKKKGEGEKEETQINSEKKPIVDPDSVGRRMRYECALLLTGTLPDDAPPPLPRFWDPQPTRRMRRGK